MSQLAETLQRGAADGTISPQQAASALALRLESLVDSPRMMLAHLRVLARVVRSFPADAEQHELIELLLAAASILETWGEYAPARDAIQVIEERGNAAERSRAAYLGRRMAFGETGRIDAAAAGCDDSVSAASGAARLFRAYVMWLGGAGAAVDHMREALLALEDVDAGLPLPLIVAASSAAVGNPKAATAALEIFQARLAQRTYRPDPALVALFHALRGRLQYPHDTSLADADFRAADSIVDDAPHSPPWACVKILHAEALLSGDLDAAEREIALIEASPAAQNFAVRRLIRAFDVARVMISGQYDAFQLAIREQAYEREVLRAFAASADEVAAVLRHWQHVCDIASGAESLAGQRHSSALLDRFLVTAVMNRSPRAGRVMRHAAAAHCIGRGMGWTDSDLRYLRANIMFDALPPREQAVIGLPPCPSPRCLEMEAVIAAAQLVAEKIDQSRDSLPSLLRAAGKGASEPTREALGVAIKLASMQDLRRLVDFHVGEFAKCNPRPRACAR